MIILSYYTCRLLFSVLSLAIQTLLYMMKIIQSIHQAVRVGLFQFKVECLDFLVFIPRIIYVLILENYIVNYFPILLFSLVDLCQKPKMRHLTTIKVVQTVAAKWEDLADSLEFDHPKVQIIKRNHVQDVVGACKDVLGRWLAGEGDREPRTLGILLEALEEIGNSELAKDIHHGLRATEK